jgi:hypothetical protein
MLARAAAGGTGVYSNGVAWLAWLAAAGLPIDISRVRGQWARRELNERETMSFLNELWRFMRTRKKFWLLPIFVVLGMFGAVLVLTQGSAVAPFIYTLF